MTIAGNSIKQHPMALGWILIIGGFGGIIMPVIIGFLSENLSIYWGMASIVVAIVIMLLGVFWYQFVNQRKEDTI